MNITFDSQIFQLQKHGGISRYFTELISALKIIDPKTAIKVKARFVRNDYLISIKGIKVKKSPSFIPMKMLLTLDSKRKNPRNVDLIHTTYYKREFLPSYPSIPNVITIHDMIPEDFGTLSPEEIQFSDKAEYVKNADGIICVSKFTKKRLLAHFPYLSIPISVIPLATNLFRTFPVDLELVNLKSRSSTFIYVGPRGNYKNFRLILFAAARLRLLTNQDFEIIAIGGGKFSDEERNLIQNLGLVDFVKQTEMNDFQLSRAYSTSRALIFPSRMEGFGIPQIEAFSFGCPVISSGMGALKEFDNGISMKFDANSPEDLADRMLEILKVSSRDFRDSAVAAIKHAKNFSWSETARKTTDFYKLFT